jgi:hypothetical protein
MDMVTLSVILLLVAGNLLFFWGFLTIVNEKVFGKGPYRVEHEYEEPESEDVKQELKKLSRELKRM